MSASLHNNLILVELFSIVGFTVDLGVHDLIKVNT
jgi:hypothetical protein